MLNIVTSLSLESLAQDMLTKIQATWTKPFVAPIVVFTDARTEQWFKIFTLQKQMASMNLNMTRLESFLFDALRSGDTAQYLLSPDLLRDVIMQKLLSVENGVRNLDKIREFDNIGNYLYCQDDTSEINTKHLFDFASDLAHLFIEYEATRPTIDDAIPDANDWQRKLYDGIITDGIEFNGRSYYTCPELAAKNRSMHNGKLVFKKYDTPVFVFGFSGMGQTYRRLLTEFGDTADIFIYLQTPCGDPSMGNNNIFLKHWAQFGKTNYKLFGTPYVKGSDPASYKTDTKLGIIQNAIAGDKNIDIPNAIKHINDTSLQITSAPSRIRELEIVHSAICKLLQDKKKNVTLKDILVMAPDINMYRTAIATVFNTTDQDNTAHPYIPLSIVEYSTQDSAILDILQTLYSVLKTGGLTRRLFLNLAKNSVLQYKYNISDDDINNVFIPWLDGMRIYRVHNNGATPGNTDRKKIDDWDYAIKRLLVSKLTDTTVHFENGDMEPFSDFNTSDNGLVTKFVRIISDIRDNWLNRFQTFPCLDVDGINDLRKNLMDLFATSVETKPNQFMEVLVYKKINQKLDQFIEQIQKFNRPIPFEYAFLSLIDTASNIRFNMGAAFTRGVTFASITPNSILPAKYMFLIGISSENFPGTNETLSLDRRARLPQAGDDDIPQKNTNAFLCQFMSATDELHISYVNQDLQTENEFYPAYVLDVLNKYTGITTNNITLDETRTWDMLYTPRERRNKQIAIDLLCDKKCYGSDNAPATTTGTYSLPDTVRLKQLQYFLDNPLKCYMDLVCGYDDDDTSITELENIDTNYLIEFNVKQRLVKPLFDSMTSARDADPEPKNIQWEYYSDLLPAAPFAQPIFDDIKKEMSSHIEKFKIYNDKIFGNSDIKITQYTINLQMHIGDNEYLLRGIIPMCAHDGTNIAIYVSKSKEDERTKYYHEMYALVAQIARTEQTPDREYTVHIVLLDDIEIDRVTNDIKVTPWPIKITGKIAEEKLNEIYTQAFIDGEKRYIPFFNTDIYKVGTFADLKEIFISSKDFILHKESLDPDKAIGFSPENFANEFSNALNKHKKLLEIPNPDKE